MPWPGDQADGPESIRQSGIVAHPASERSPDEDRQRDARPRPAPRAALEDASHAEWRACFTPDYTIEDPVGTGPRAMGSYEAEWHNMHTASLRLDMEIYA